MVSPGGETRCLSGEEYVFQVVPGDMDKLLLYFQGGGAAGAARACVKSANPSPPVGVFDRRNAANPFQRFTIVQVIQCSGDVHAGSADQAWLREGAEPVMQRGHANTVSVLKWVKANFPRMRSFVLAGSSAGALAVHWWARTVLEDLRGGYEHAAVIADSFGGVLPKGMQPYLARVWRLCDTGLLQDRLQDTCENGSLTVQETYVDAMRSNPNVTFASLSSKLDAVQIRYYNIWVGLNDPTVPPIGGMRFYAELSSILRVYSQQPNHISYLVDGKQHTFMDHSIFLTTSPAGENDQGAAAGPLLTTWLRGLTEKGDPVSSVCFSPAVFDWAGVPSSQNEGSQCSGTTVAQSIRVPGEPCS
eukprot:CAMPEP_0179115266 /NCGR_PEP_ID=MMETSP0796-20121207/54011_1 /TAXON_ID=73915 /ORGANISM="Pyrodinium bahamense, Strain pbaha01" /LENGTH=359 /DNA_ID=CAMNT_0020813511 /DNA_START=108 /DNA_END=1185 /DNA_ORIENTATION=-